MSRIEVDPEELMTIARGMRRDVEAAQIAVDSMPDGADGGVASVPIADAAERLYGWLGVLGQSHATLANIVDDIAAGVLRDEERISEDLLKVARSLEVND